MEPNDRPDSPLPSLPDPSAAPPDPGAARRSARDARRGREREATVPWWEVGVYQNMPLFPLDDPEVPVERRPEPPGYIKVAKSINGHTVYLTGPQSRFDPRTYSADDHVETFGDGTYVFELYGSSGGMRPYATRILVVEGTGPGQQPWPVPENLEELPPWTYGAGNDEGPPPWEREGVPQVPGWNPSWGPPPQWVVARGRYSWSKPPPKGYVPSGYMREDTPQTDTTPTPWTAAPTLADRIEKIIGNSPKLQETIALAAMTFFAKMTGTGNTEPQVNVELQKLQVELESRRIEAAERAERERLERQSREQEAERARQQELRLEQAKLEAAERQRQHDLRVEEMKLRAAIQPRSDPTAALAEATRLASMMGYEKPDNAAKPTGNETTDMVSAVLNSPFGAALGTAVAKVMEVVAEKTLSGPQPEQQQQAQQAQQAPMHAIRYEPRQIPAQVPQPVPVPTNGQGHAPRGLVPPGNQIPATQPEGEA